MLRVLLLCDSIKVLNDHPKIISGIISLLEQVFYAHIENFDGFKGLTFNPELVSNILKLDFADNIRKVFSKI